MRAANHQYYHSLSPAQRRARYRTANRWRYQNPTTILGNYLSINRNARTQKLLETSAHSAVYWATRAGILLFPDTCDACGKPVGRARKHHEDYSRPLWLTTLCTSCHSKAHRPPRAKLSPEDVRTIRALGVGTKVPAAKIAEAFGVHRGTIFKILRGQTWSQVA